MAQQGDKFNAYIQEHSRIQKNNGAIPYEKCYSLLVPQLDKLPVIKAKRRCDLKSKGGQIYTYTL